MPGFTVVGIVEEYWEYWMAAGLQQQARHGQARWAAAAAAAWPAPWESSAGQSSNGTAERRHCSILLPTLANFPSSNATTTFLPSNLCFLRCLQQRDNGEIFWDTKKLRKTSQLERKFNKGKVQKKNLKKKLTNVSFMYVCVAGNCEMLGFFSFFPPTIVW